MREFMSEQDGESVRLFGGGHEVMSAARTFIPVDLETSCLGRAIDRSGFHLRTRCKR